VVLAGTLPFVVEEDGAFQFRGCLAAVAGLGERAAGPLAKDAAHAMQRLLTLNMAEICPGAAPLVVDVRQEKTYRETRRAPKHGFDGQECYRQSDAGSLKFQVSSQMLSKTVSRPLL
jgi:hypothetical protein